LRTAFLLIAARTAVVQVQQVAAEGIPPTSHATGLTNVYRDDGPAPCLTPETGPRFY